MKWNSASKWELKELSYEFLLISVLSTYKFSPPTFISKIKICYFLHLIWCHWIVEGTQQILDDWMKEWMNLSSSSILVKNSHFFPLLFPLLPSVIFTFSNVNIYIMTILMFWYHNYLFFRAFLGSPARHTMVVSSLLGRFMCHSKLLHLQYHQFCKATASYISNFPTFSVFNYGYPCHSSLQFPPHHTVSSVSFLCNFSSFSHND